MTEDEERKLFRHVARQRACPWARRDLAWMRLMRHTGIRVGTLRRLTEADARRALADGHLLVADDNAKGGHGYQVYLTKPARRALQELLSVRRQLGRVKNPDAPLVPGRQRGFVSERLLQQRLKMWARAAEIRADVSPHWLRHTCAQRIMSRSTAADPRGVVQLALGHMDPRSTWVYTLPTHEDVAQAMREAS